LGEFYISVTDADVDLLEEKNITEIIASVIQTIQRIGYSKKSDCFIVSQNETNSFYEIGAPNNLIVNTFSF
jgi:hypothetical protein